MADLIFLDQDSPIVQKAKKVVGNTEDYEYALINGDEWLEHREQLEAEDWRGIATVLSEDSILIERRKK